jgi:hypothetical protein
LSGHFDGVHRTGVEAGTAIGAGIGIDYPDITLFRDGADRTGIVTGSTVDAFIRNMISHRIHLLCSGMGSLHISIIWRIYTPPSSALSTLKESLSDLGDKALAIGVVML